MARGHNNQFSLWKKDENESDLSLSLLKIKLGAGAWAGKGNYGVKRGRRKMFFGGSNVRFNKMKILSPLSLWTWGKYRRLCSQRRGIVEFLGLEWERKMNGKNRRNICRALEGVERDEKMTDGQALSLKLLEWATAMQWVNVREEFDEDKLREDLHS